MREIHNIQEEKLQVQQQKEKATMEKSHSKSLKKSSKNGSSEQVQREYTSQIVKLAQNHAEKVNIICYTILEYLSCYQLHLLLFIAKHNTTQSFYVLTSNGIQRVIFSFYIQL